MRSVLAAPRSSWWAQALQNRLVAIVLAMVVIVPLVAGPVDVRWTGAAALVSQAFALVLAVALLWRAKLNLNRERVLTFLRTGANLPVLLLLGLAVVSCALTPYNKAFAVQETIKLAGGVLLYFVVAYQFRQSKHMSMLVDTLLFVAIIASLGTMAQYAMNAASRGTALFGNQQPLGSLLMILLPVAASIAVTEKLSRRQIVAQITTVMTLGALLLAHTRSAWIGAAAGLGVLALMAVLAPARDERKAVQTRELAAQKHKVVLPLMLAVVTAGFLFLMTSQNSSVVQRGSSLTNLSSDFTFQHRQAWWSGAVEMVKERPLTGFGTGQFPVLQHEYTGQGAALSNGVHGSLANQAHNFYLQTAAELGLPGLLLVVAILGSFLYAGIKRIGKMDAGIRRSLLIASIGSIVAFSLDALSSPSWQFGQVSMFFWLILGAGVGCVRPRTKQDEEEAPITLAPRVLRPVVLVAAALMFSLVVLPTATLTAQASHRYEDEDDNDTVRDILITLGIAGLLAFLFAEGPPSRSNRGGQGRGEGPPPGPAVIR